MSQFGFTPILIYSSGTSGNTPAAANLTTSTNGTELAINYVDGKLFYKDNNNTVQTIATKNTASGIFNTISGTTITATTQFTGPGTGLTGTASGLTAGFSANSTNIANGAANQIPYQTGSGATSFIAAPTVANTGLVWVNNTIKWGNPVSSGLLNGAANQIAYQTAANTTAFIAAPTVANTILTWNNNGFSWANSSTALLTVSIQNGAANQIPYQTASSTTAFMTAPTVANTALVWNNTGFVWTNPISSAILNGATNQIVYQSAASTTSFITAPTANTYLTYNGSSFAWNQFPIVANTFTTSSTSQVSVDSFSTSTYRSAEYQVQMTSGINYHTIKLLLIHDGTNVYMTQYGELFTSSSLGTFDSTITAGTLNLLFTPTNASTTVKLNRVPVPV